MVFQVKGAVGLIPTHFDLALGLQAAGEAGNLSEGELGDVEGGEGQDEGACQPGTPESTDRAQKRTNGSTCSAGELQKASSQAGRSAKESGESMPGHDSRNKRKEARRLRRRKKREHDMQEHGLKGGGLKGVSLKRRNEMIGAGALSFADIRGEDLKVAKGGWLGSLTRTHIQTEGTLQEALGKGFELIRWDGRSPRAILDKAHRVVAVLAGMAKGDFEKDVVANALAAFREESETLPSFRSECARRGQFHAALTGISYGGGMPEPVQTSTQRMYKNAVARLKGSEAVKRLAGFQNQAFQAYFPRTHAYYQHCMEELRREKEHLEFPFVDTLPSAAFNLGPRTVCTPHRDAKNLSFGICCITALGNFDPAAGGHLILQELRVVVEFPSGATVLIPSAVVTHSNTSIREEERRYSFTQYASGSLFSYIENGMQTTKSVLLALTRDKKAEWKKEGCVRWGKGLSMFPFIWEYASQTE